MPMRIEKEKSIGPMLVTFALLIVIAMGSAMHSHLSSSADSRSVGIISR